ncbi:heat shock factor protein 1-like [Sarcophilus harrisii]
MERPCGSGPGPAGAVNAPSFLTKLWKLVDDPATDALVSWSPSGRSFLVFDQAQFAKDLLPLYFKHNHMASFVRQLNMYGFHKVVHFPQGLAKKAQRDPVEYQHPDFLRGREQLLESIKRRAPNASGARAAEAQQGGLAGLGRDVQAVKEKQESTDVKLSAMKHEADALRGEVSALRQKQAQQQKVVGKLAGFLMTLAKNSQLPRTKKKVPQLPSGDSSARSPAKCCCRDCSRSGAPGAPPSDSLPPAADAGPAVAHVMELLRPELLQPELQAPAQMDVGEPFCPPVAHVMELLRPELQAPAQMDVGEPFGPPVARGPADALGPPPLKGQPGEDARACGAEGPGDPAPRQPASQ